MRAREDLFACFGPLMVVLCRLKKYTIFIHQEDFFILRDGNWMSEGVRWSKWTIFDGNWSKT